MMRSLISLFLSISFLFCCSGCATGKAKPIPKTGLDKLFDNDFQGLNIPASNKIKEVGSYKKFPYAAYDEIWDASIIVLLQHGIIAFVSKSSGVLIGIGDPPLALFVEKSGDAGIYTSSLYSYYPKKLYKISPAESLLFARNYSINKAGIEGSLTSFSDKVATQIYAKDKWKYLFK